LFFTGKINEVLLDVVHVSKSDVLKSVDKSNILSCFPDPEHLLDDNYPFFSESYDIPSEVIAKSLQVGNLPLKEDLKLYIAHRIAEFNSGWKGGIPICDMKLDSYSNIFRTLKKFSIYLLIISNFFYIV
jgi:hypothetical protein